MICTICKLPENWAEYQVNGAIRACPECKARFDNEILLVCLRCNSMAFIVKTPKNIERLQYFIHATITHFWMSNVIVPMNGCPHCITFQQSMIGEPKAQVKESCSRGWGSFSYHSCYAWWTGLWQLRAFNTLRNATGCSLSLFRLLSVWQFSM